MLEFNEQVNRLRSVYGDKAYPDERVRLLWREVGSLSSAWFESAVSGLIQSCRQAPLAHEFSPMISDERERVYRKQKEKELVTREITSYSCEYCKDMGVFLCIKNDDRSVPYVFRCHCARGRSDLRRKIPHYTRESADEGLRFYELHWTTGA